jgi:D-aminoacyl-tRNA deacylase
MKAVIQRVSRANVYVGENLVGEINQGFLVLLGISALDEEEDCKWLCNKIGNMRLFNDESGLMNKSLQEVEGDILLISQFTLHASTKKGNRPSFLDAMKPKEAEQLYNYCIQLLQPYCRKTIQTGQFGAHMEVTLTNDGPVTIIIDSKNKE